MLLVSIISYNNVCIFYVSTDDQSITRVHVEENNASESGYSSNSSNVCYKAFYLLPFVISAGILIDKTPFKTQA